MEVVRGKYVLLNGSFYEAQQINENIEPNSIQIYEVFRIINSKPIFFDDHIERLISSFLGIGKNVNIEFSSDIKRNTERLIKKNNISNGNIKILCQFTDKKLIIFIYFIPHSYPSELDYQNGVVVGLFEATRKDPNIKATTYVRDSINSFLRTKELFEVLLVDEKDEITEGSRTNVFFVDSNDNMITAQDATVLKGVTRKYVIQICKKNNIPLLYREVTVNELNKFKSAFLTGTSPKILPIKKIENITFDVNSNILRRIMDNYESILSYQTYLSK